VAAPTHRLSLLSGPLAVQALRAGERSPSPELLNALPPVRVGANRESARGRVAPGEAGRLLVLADAVDSHWVATLDGQRLDRRTAWGWAQAFTVPASGGVLDVHYEQTSRHLAVGIEGVLLLVVVILAAPGRRRGRGLERYTDDDGERDTPSRDERFPLAPV
jgi:hypothetical protein